MSLGRQIVFSMQVKLGICPGYVDTDMIRGDVIDKKDNPAAAEQRMIDYAPMKRIATPAGDRHGVLYLASFEARFVTGIPCRSMVAIRLAVELSLSRITFIDADLPDAWSENVCNLRSEPDSVWRGQGHVTAPASLETLNEVDPERVRGAQTGQV